MVLIRFSKIMNGVQESVRFGFTRCDPMSFGAILPTQAPSMLKKTSPFWTIQLEEYFCHLNRILFYYFTAAGSVHFGIDGVEKGVFQIPSTQQPLWAVVDVHGNCSGIEFSDRTVVGNEPHPLWQSHNSNSLLPQNAPYSASVLNYNSSYNPFKPPSVKSPMRTNADDARTRPSRNAHPNTETKAQPSVQQTVVRTTAVTSNVNSSEAQQIGKTAENRTNQAVVNHVFTILQQATRSANVPQVPVQLPPTNSSHTRTRVKTDQMPSWPSTNIPSRSTLSHRAIEPPSRRDTAKMPVRSTAFSSDRFRDRLETLSKNVVTMLTEQEQKMNREKAQPSVRTNVACVPCSRSSTRRNAAQMSAAPTTSTPKSNAASSNMLKPLPSIGTVAKVRDRPVAVNSGMELPLTNEHQNKDSIDDGEGSECSICYEKPIDAAVYKCGHMCMCFECAEKLKNTKGACPICRAAIQDVLRIYKS